MSGYVSVYLDDEVQSTVGRRVGNRKPGIKGGREKRRRENGKNKRVETMQGKE